MLLSDKWKKKNRLKAVNTEEFNVEKWDLQIVLKQMKEWPSFPKLCKKNQKPKHTHTQKSTRWRFAFTGVCQLFPKKRRKKPKSTTEETFSCFYVSFLGKDWFQTLRTLKKDKIKWQRSGIFLMNFPAAIFK